jgi:hypothetical protein
MIFHTRRVSFFLVCAFVLAAASVAHAQYRPVPPQMGSQPPPAPTTFSQGAMPTSPGYQPPSTTPGQYYGYPGWGNYYQSPIAGALQGTASVINAQGQYMNQTQDARIRYEQWQQTRMDTKSKAIEQYIWEQGLVPTNEDLKEKRLQYELRIARNSPPANEIWSGEALNTLLRDIQQKQVRGVMGPSVIIDPAQLPKIGFTDGTTVGGLPIFGNEGKLQWPFELQSDLFDKNRARLDQLAPQAVQQAKAGRVEFKTIKDLQAEVDKMQAALSANIADMSPTDAIVARRYLNQFNNAIVTLKTPNAQSYFNGTQVARGDTVGELVDSMTRQGLKFAPAIQSHEAAYTGLYNSLLAYDLSLGQQTAGARAP